LRLQTQVPLAKGIMHEVREVPAVNAKLKRLTRRRRQLPSEKVRIAGAMRSRGRSSADRAGVVDAGNLTRQEHSLSLALVGPRPGWQNR
jgi:hypothetical protein